VTPARFGIAVNERSQQPLGAKRVRTDAVRAQAIWRVPRRRRGAAALPSAV